MSVSSSARRFRAAGTSKKPPQVNQFLTHVRQLLFQAFKHSRRQFTVISSFAQDFSRVLRGASLLVRADFGLLF
jgi:hypothetical protein